MHKIEAMDLLTEEKRKKEELCKFLVTYYQQRKVIGI